MSESNFGEFLMEGNIVKAATSLGICVIISAVILFVGMGRLGKSVERAGSNVKASVSVPSTLMIQQSGQLKIAPLRLDIGTDQMNVDVTTKGQTTN